MKKKLLFFILFLFFPFKIKASTYISNYYIDATITGNDMHIKEVFIYKGNYNGAFKNLYYGTTDLENSLLIDSNLYNPDDILLNKIGEIELNEPINFNIIHEEVIPFILNNEASIGSKGYYSVKKDFEKYTYKIFNPGGTKAFYIEYTLKNVVVSHEDVNEVWLNIFKEISDEIENIELHLHLPDWNENIKVWAHGPLTGNIEIKSPTLVYVTIPSLTQKDYFDIRFTFDNTFLSSKQTSIQALDKIIEEETKWADEANKIREEYRKQLEEQERKLKSKAFFFHIFGLLWIIGLVPLIIYVYKKYDKEHVSTFKGKYFRDIPSDIDPPIVAYLLDRKIDSNDLSATLLNLVYKKVVSFKEINKKDYEFSYENKDIPLSEIEKKTIEVFFNGGNTVLLSEFKKRATKAYSTVLRQYGEWCKLCNEKAEKENYYEQKLGIRLFSCCYSVLGFSLIFLKTSYVTTWFFILVIVLSSVSFIYFLVFYKRTIHGNEEYLKWMGLKNFMNDFGNMDVKELPEIQLWEKYLVYAVTLGCAEKLSKTMKIKFKEMNQYENINRVSSTSFDPISFNNQILAITKVNDFVTHSITSAITSAKRVAASNDSSGSGSGGGFSSGGSSFGGFSGGGGGSTGHF